MRSIARLLTGGSASPPMLPLGHIALVGAGGALAIATVAVLGQLSGMPWLLGSFGASCVLLFGFPEAPFSQPRNLFLGHLLCSIIGLGFLTYVGSEWWSLSLAFGVSLMVMLVTRTVHPPAGSNPVIIFLTRPDWSFLVYPTLAGVLALWFLAFIFFRATCKDMKFRTP